MSTDVQKYPGTAVSRVQDGVDDWVGMVEVKAFDYYSAQLQYGDTRNTRQFTVSNFGFSVEAEHNISKLVVGVRIQTAAQAETTPYIEFTPTGMSTIRIYTSTDASGAEYTATWTTGLPSVSTLNSSSFAVVCETGQNTPRQSYRPYVDYVRLTATYEEPGSASIAVATKNAALSGTLEETYDTTIGVTARKAYAQTIEERASTFTIGAVATRAILESEGNVMFYLREGTPRIVAKQNKIDKEGGSQIWQ